MENEYVLEMNNISKFFPGVKALDHAQLKVRPGTVHSLMGENGAGKSTLMKCLFGIYTPDEGEILLNGESVRFANPAEALENRVSMVHQELNQVPDQNVMENLWLGRYPIRGGLIDEKKMYADTMKIFRDLDIDVDPRARVGTLPVSKKQMIEIGKAVSYNARVLVMDEPTSSLTEKEVGHLFRIIRRLIEKGSSVVYISHKMEEILQISDDVTVMRDGKWIATQPAGAMTIDGIIRMMVGREMTERYPCKSVKPGDVLMKVEDLSSASPAFTGVSFELHRGEILGVAGLVGSRRTEVLETIFGIRRRGCGTITVNSREVRNRSPQEAIANGFAMLTEERRKDGIFAGLSVAFNMAINNLDCYRKNGLLCDRLIRSDVDRMVKTMNIKTPSAKQRLGNLSGGNQQKVILGRWLLTQPNILLLDEPTRGIDVGAKYEIYQLINELAADGKGIVIVSSEMPELFGVCDRILVMSNGRQSGIFDSKEADQETIMQASAKYI